MKKYIIIALIQMVLIVSCEKNTTTIDDSTNGSLKILLTDAPGVYDSVKISFSNISAHIDSSWVDFNMDPITVDLLTLTNGNFIVLGEQELGAGYYSQIRLFIDSAEVGVDGEVYPLSIPSNIQTGLKLIHPIEIKEGSTYELILDFDVNRSIVVMGPKSNPNGYKLKPTIRMASRALTGSISGHILNFEHLPVAYAIQNADTIATTQINPTDGMFKLAFLTEGDYFVSVEDTLDQKIDIDPVTVIAGQDQNLGDLTLQ